MKFTAAPTVLLTRGFGPMKPCSARYYALGCAQKEMPLVSAQCQSALSEILIGASQRMVGAMGDSEGLEKGQAFQDGRRNWKRKGFGLALPDIMLHVRPKSPTWTG